MHVILKRQLVDIERIVCTRKKCKPGKRNVLKGKTVVSTLKVLEILKNVKQRQN